MTATRRAGQGPEEPRRNDLELKRTVVRWALRPKYDPGSPLGPGITSLSMTEGAERAGRTMLNLGRGARLSRTGGVLKWDR